MKSSKLRTGSKVIVVWEDPEQRQWYGCPNGVVEGFDQNTSLYAVRHNDKGISYVLYYARPELAATLSEKLKLKAKNNKIIQRIIKLWNT